MVVAAASSSASALGSLPLGVGGVFVAVALGFLLVYLELVDATPGRTDISEGLEAVVATLLATFLVIVVLHASTVAYAA